ncbi:indolepyruvate ferredoxin oxidoreductase subunit alpha [Aristaeella hokkaidonensis]|uniref:Indolepyruvate ferredoxin oxidoreductase subunit alpha n=2 Tax=Aristaeella hokkaidonensis TaxID=3046382 RepID=A0AC61NB79_9FIRM|nr:indolepyruvate ferredoxin oxidoreductase subunit alpha [Aristaeella hokkaidonensis]
MGNGAIALGALAAGVNLVAGYPGTPSSEIIETISHYPHEGLHLEWSVNEKAALEVAAAAAYSGARAMVTMKQMGLNVASDPLMSVAYIGVKGGLVIVSADDPGPISSQTEQDTRRYADFCRIPVFDPSSPEEAYEMIQEAFAYSEKYSTPVLFRPTTRVCHAYASVETPDSFAPKAYEGFERDPGRWVIFPRLSYINHGKMEARNVEIGRDFSSLRFNTVEGEAAEKAVVTSGVSYTYVKECLKGHDGVRLIRIATAFPFPEDFILKALDGVKEVLCIEELSPFIEEQILRAAGKHHLALRVSGKLDGSVPHNGENSVELCTGILNTFLRVRTGYEQRDLSDAPALPVRPPVLCAGCPHRASFYAVKKAMKGRKAVFCGDIGCYTLGNAMPLDMVDTCLCMGAGITMAQGLSHMNRDTVSFAFVGDSTFFASGMTGVVNAVYNEADMILCVLDNSTTAMTGHQPHPGTGRNMMGNAVEKVNVEKVLEGIGVKKIVTVDPLTLEDSIRAVQECAEETGVRAIIFKSPCVAITKPDKKCAIDTAKCVNCKKCIREIGCPALITVDGRVAIDRNLCAGCGLCSHICPTGAIGGEQ